MNERIINIMNIVWVSYGILVWFSIFMLFKFIFNLNIVNREFLKLLKFFIILLVLWKSINIIVVNEINR